MNDNGFKILLIIVMLLEVWHISSQQRTIAGLERHLAVYGDRYQRQAARDGRAYQSFDGGKQWYVTTTDETGRVEVLGPVEEIDPEGFREQQGMKALSRYVMAHGSIGSKGPITADEIRLLQDAGFRVERAP